jgi:hypothetical protein
MEFSRQIERKECQGLEHRNMFQAEKKLHEDLCVQGATNSSWLGQ